MPYDLTNLLVIGISSRALFNLEEENKIFEERTLEEYIEYQLDHENEILRPGTAFRLAQGLLALNKQHTHRLVEVIVMSKIGRLNQTLTIDQFLA